MYSFNLTRGVVDSLLCDVESLGDHSPPDEPMDHTFAENISLDQKGDTVSSVENLYNGDEINPLNAIKTENEEVQGTEELASIIESDGIHNDRNLDTPPTLKIMDSNVEINSLNDAGELE
uniref:Uncharacterized protein n=1 Tax=Panagrolaimus davidi TaxID=227884 RepID=A0A914PPF6_9BILA